MRYESIAKFIFSEEHNDFPSSSDSPLLIFVLISVILSHGAVCQQRLPFVSRPSFVPRDGARGHTMFTLFQIKYFIIFFLDYSCSLIKPNKKFRIDC